MAVVDKITAVFIVGYEHAAVTVFIIEEREQRFEIARSGAFPDHDILAQLKFLDRFFCRRTLVIGSYTCSYVCIKIFTRKERCVTIDPFAVRICALYLPDYLFISSDRAERIHEFGKSCHSFFLIERFEFIST